MAYSVEAASCCGALDTDNDWSGEPYCIISVSAYAGAICTLWPSHVSLLCRCRHGCLLLLPTERPLSFRLFPAWVPARTSDLPPALSPMFGPLLPALRKQGGLFDVSRDTPRRTAIAHRGGGARRNGNDGGKSDGKSRSGLVEGGCGSDVPQRPRCFGSDPDHEQGG